MSGLCLADGVLSLVFIGVCHIDLLLTELLVNGDQGGFGMANGGWISNQTKKQETRSSLKDNAGVQVVAETPGIVSPKVYDPFNNPPGIVKESDKAVISQNPSTFENICKDVEDGGNPSGSSDDTSSENNKMEEQVAAVGRVEGLEESVSEDALKISDLFYHNNHHEDEKVRTENSMHSENESLRLALS